MPNLYSCTWQTWNATGKAQRLRGPVVGPSKAYFHESTSLVVVWAEAGGGAGGGKKSPSVAGDEAGKKGGAS